MILPNGIPLLVNSKQMCLNVVTVSHQNGHCFRNKLMRPIVLLSHWYLKKCYTNNCRAIVFACYDINNSNLNNMMAKLRKPSVTFGIHNCCHGYPVVNHREGTFGTIIVVVVTRMGNSVNVKMRKRHESVLWNYMVCTLYCRCSNCTAW